jgi:DNA-binding NarL/FixJ family response regulator
MVVDDHPIVRVSMRQVLDAADDVTVLTEGTSGTAALHLFVEHRLDALVLDGNLPHPSGMDDAQQPARTATRATRSVAPAPPTCLIATREGRIRGERDHAPWQRKER